MTILPRMLCLGLRGAVYEQARQVLQGRETVPHDQNKNCGVDLTVNRKRGSRWLIGVGADHMMASNLCPRRREGRDRPHTPMCMHSYYLCLYTPSTSRATNQPISSRVAFSGVLSGGRVRIIIHIRRCMYAFISLPHHEQSIT
jgi:hypothetical protein